MIYYTIYVTDKSWQVTRPAMTSKEKALEGVVIVLDQGICRTKAEGLQLVINLLEKEILK